MSHSKLNRILAAAVFAITFVVYWSTVAPTTSFWDCGEFIASSYILGVPHPPGAPLYILMGRVFSMLPIAGDVALRVNMTSPIFSAFTAMFTYLIIVRLILLWKEEPRSWLDKLTVYASGVIGALAFAFSDSQWFNSVEAEVYAGSMFFTAIVVWLILKWMDRAESAESDRYILLISYLLGLAIGVHLLNLLALPAIAMIIFARRYRPKKRETLTELSLMIVMSGAGAATLWLINSAIVKGFPALMKSYGLEAVGLVVVSIVIAAALVIRQNKRITALALMSAILVIVGYSTYSAIFIRSTLDPIIDENDPDTPARLVSYLNREQYGDWSIAQRRAPLWEYQIKKMYVRYFGWQFIGKGTTLDEHGRIVEILSLRGLLGIPFLVGLIGFLYHFYRDWRRAFPILALFIMTGLAIIVYLNQEDPQPRERDYAYTGSFFAFALWIGIGVTALIDFVRSSFAKEPAAAPRIGSKAVTSEGRIIQRNATAPGMAHGGAALVMASLVFIAVPGKMFWFNYDTHDRSGNYVAFDYSYNILQSCEKDALIFTNGDNDTFPLWFLQYVHNIRPDVRVINLSLLNTNWYIKQLRDDEPRVPIRMSDAEIEGIQPIPWEAKPVKIQVPKSIYDRYYAEVVKIDSTIEYQEKPAVIIDQLRPTLYNQGLRVQDMMILRILQDNQFRRPVYFAVTVAGENKIGLDPYLRMDGLAFRVLPVRINSRLVDPDIMWANLSEKFQFRNLDNPEVYYNDNIQSLLQNYRSAFFRLAQFHLMRGEKDRALQVLDRMSEVMPESVIPINDPRVNQFVGYMYSQAGRPEELDRRYRQTVIDNFDRIPDNQKLSYADYFRQRNHAAFAESLVRSTIARSQSFRDGYTWLSRFYESQKQYGKAIEVLNHWLQSNPDDERIKADLERFRILAQADSTSPSPREATTDSTSQ